MEPKLVGFERWLDGEEGSPTKFSDIWRIFLCALADRALKSLDEEERPVVKKNNRPYYYDLSLIAEVEGIFVSQQELQRIASHLEQHGWVSIARRAPVQINMLPAGIEEANKLIGDVYPLYNAASVRGSNKPNAEIPGADRFVRLDDNSQVYFAAIKRLEELIAGANELRVNDWPEKDGVVASLNSALGMIRSKYVNRRTVLAAVSSAIAFIVAKFAEAPIADIANRTWEAVKALF